MSSKANCGSCWTPVLDGEMGLQCDRCDRWFHYYDCMDMVLTDYIVLEMSNLLWFCHECHGEVRRDFKLAKEFRALKEKSADLPIGLSSSSSVEIAEDLGATSVELDRISLDSSLVSSSSDSSVNSVVQDSNSSSVSVELDQNRVDDIASKVRQIRISSDKDSCRIPVRESAWQKVRSKPRANQVKSSVRPRVLVDVPMSNSFSVLDSDRLEGLTTAVSASPELASAAKSPIGSKPDLVVIGDSQVRYLGSNLGRQNRVECFPGATVEIVSRKLGLGKRPSDISLDGSQDVVVHVGGNDIMREGSEATLRAYSSLLRNVRDKGGNILVTGILPRASRGQEWSSRALGINSRLGSLCDSLGIDFLNLWEDFYGFHSLYAGDGVHLSYRGVAKLGLAIRNRLDRIAFLSQQGNY